MQGYNQDEGIKIVPYNPLWHDIAQQEIRFLHAILGEDVIIEHFGSTAIRGCSAKDIIDIQIWASNAETVDRFKQILSPIYQGVSSPEKQAIGFLCFDKEVEISGEIRRTHHIHVQSDWEQWKRGIYFRNYLNDNPTEVAIYEQIKLLAAQKFPQDMTAYSKMKDNYIAGVLDKAKKIYG